MTLYQLVKAAKDRDDRWELVKLIRLAQLRLTGQAVPNAALPNLTGRQRAVLRVGRLSEAGVQSGVDRIRENPDHLDLDWFGAAAVNWWQAKDAAGNGVVFDGSAAEGTVAMGLRHYLEVSLGIETAAAPPADATPGNWKWPGGVGLGNRYWWDLLTDDGVVPVSGVGFDDLQIDWDIYRARALISCAIRGHSMVVETPWTVGPGLPAPQS
jgi:hypothetical protein